MIINKDQYQKAHRSMAVHKFFVDLALFDSQKQNGFRQCNKVEPREDGYGIKGIRSARCTFESKPRYLWNPGF